MKIYQIDCGRLHGIVKSQNEGCAFRTLIRRLMMSTLDYGELARFREITIGHGNRIFKQSEWFYIDPHSLIKQSSKQRMR